MSSADVTEAWIALEFELWSHDKTTAEVLLHLKWTVGSPNVTELFFAKFYAGTCHDDCLAFAKNHGGQRFAVYMGAKCVVLER